MDLERLKARAAEIAEKEGKELLTRTTASEKLFQRAIEDPAERRGVELPGGRPVPGLPRARQGLDRDRRRRHRPTRDFHGGFGVNVVGHAHPKIVEAIKKAAEDAIHFAVTTEITVALAEEICERFQCDQMRFVNSGTEATMDAIRVARAATGRDKHHQDGGLVPRPPRLGAVLGGARGRRARPAAQRRPERQALVHDPAHLQGRARGRCGTPRSSCRSTTRRPWSRRSPTTPGEIAAVILEPVMMNIGIVVPARRLPPGAEGRLREARRDPDLRRGQVRRDDRLRRCGRALRRGAAPRGVGQGDRRRRHHRRLRRRRGDHGVRHEGRGAAGHLQREPAVVGGRARGAHRRC